MGTWGSAVFDNDAAGDWMGQLLDEDRYQLIGEALNTVVEDATDADDCCAALAAAEVVAAARGWPVRGFPRELKEWINGSDYQPTDGARSLAIQAVRQVLKDSDLATLWSENPKEEKKWRAALDDLIDRLGKTPKLAAKKKPKQPAPTGVKEAVKRLKGRNGYVQLTPAGHAKYVHVDASIDGETLAACLPFVARTKVLRLGSGGMTATPEKLTYGDTELAALGQFKSLEVLEVVNTQITDATLARLAKLSNLKELNLNLTQTTDAGLAHLAGLKKLEKLNLFKAEVTDGGLAHLKGLTNMAELDLRYTKITGAGLKYLSGLTNLWILELDHTLIDDDGIAQLSKLKKLARLTIGGKRITDEAMTTIGKLTALRGLSLENTKITDAGLKTLAALPVLEIVHLAGTGVTTEGARWLRKTCPRLEVIGRDK